MQLIKHKIKLKPTVDQNISITFSENVGLSGLQEDIDNYVEEQTGLSVNDVEDGETFKYKPIDDFNLNAYFWNGSGYSKDYTYAGFTTGETSNRSEVILRSFFIMQIYDSVSTENQTLLHTGYYNGYNFIQQSTSTASFFFDTDEDEEFTNLYIPQWFINSMTGDTVNLYGKLSFYNAKTGELQLFSQKFGLLGIYELPTVEEDLYITLPFTASTFQYDPPTLYAHELKNTNYTDKINESISSFDNQKPTYPTGNTFVNTGKYIDN